MKRKDGRELVTEHPVAWEDMIDVHHGPGEIPENAVVCKASRDLYEAWMDDI